ncbi:50S ribosomal protein L28 [Thermobaculum terrenum]|uniref:50S ribosomal protein L28 n=1 Tax=Thermobaculum terrenum TaxID=166501 RepID=UPI001F4A0636|nr:50S ribosomal protein L28 [Thermobaculum terrenum]
MQDSNLEVTALARCEVCGKKTQFGRSIQYHHGGKWARRAQKTNRPFKPNVHRQTVMLNGELVKIHICTRCLRTLAKKAESTAA